MGSIDRLLPSPRGLELDFVILPSPPDLVWQRLRHDELPFPASARSLFAIRTPPGRAADDAPPARVLRLDDLRPSPDAPGFAILAEGEREVAVGAIGKVWLPDGPFAHAADAEAFSAFAEPGFLKVAWALRVLPYGEGSRVEFELRTDPTDEGAWRRFRRCFLLFGPGSRALRRSFLRALARAYGGPGERGAREVHPELQRLGPGDVIAATPDGHEGFEVLAVDAPRDDWRDVLEGAGGAARMLAGLITPFLRGARSHWGLDEQEAARERPGDEVIPEPRWGWTHAVEIDAPAPAVWPWVAQIGADRGGFYSYQALENAVGCGVRNAETVRPELAHREGDALVLHPRVPPLKVTSVVEGHHLLAVGAPDPEALATNQRWTAATWLFQVEPLGADRCRFVSRYRCACSDDLATRLAFGPALLEPVGFAMDRRMLLGVKERAERSHAPPSGA